MKKDIEMSSMETSLLWEALRLLAQQTDDPVKRREIKILLKKMGARSFQR